MFAIIAEDLKSAIGTSAVEHIEKKPTNRILITFQKMLQIIAITSGIMLLVILLIIALFLPNPTPFQFFIFRTVMALAAAGFGAAIPGFLRIELPIWQKGIIHAGGAIAMFVLVYLINPASLIIDK